MSNEIGILKEKVGRLDTATQELQNDHSQMAKFLDAFDKRETDTRKAIWTLVEALARVPQGAPHLTKEDQAKIKKLLGIG